MGGEGKDRVPHVTERDKGVCDMRLSDTEHSLAPNTVLTLPRLTGSWRSACVSHSPGKERGG